QVKQGELKRSKARGERVVVPTKLVFGELAESWYEAKRERLRARTARYYRDALDIALLPRFGSWRVPAIDADAIASFVRDLERVGLHAVDPSRDVRPLGRSSIVNYLKPMRAVLALAVRRGLIASNPFDHLLPDDRPKRDPKATPYEWSDEDV